MPTPEDNFLKLIFDTLSISYDEDAKLFAFKKSDNSVMCYYFNTQKTLCINDNFILKYFHDYQGIKDGDKVFTIIHNFMSSNLDIQIREIVTTKDIDRKYNYSFKTNFFGFTLYKSIQNITAFMDEYNRNVIPYNVIGPGELFDRGYLAENIINH